MIAHATADRAAPRADEGDCMALLLLVLLAAGLGLAGMPASPVASRGYHTKFPRAEDPISQGGRWLNGGADGLDWTDVQTTHAMAVGTMPGDAGYPQEYADSTAVLKGAWGRNQTVRAKLRVPNPSNQSGVYEEVELRVRTTIVPHSITGYEINCSVNTSDPYMQVVRWNGALADFTLLDGRGIGCADGDVIEATVTGRRAAVISVYKNGAFVFSATDNYPFTSGAPGVGFFLEGATGLNADYGFSEFRTTTSGGRKR